MRWNKLIKAYIAAIPVRCRPPGEVKQNAVDRRSLLNAVSKPIAAKLGAAENDSTQFKASAARCFGRRMSCVRERADAVSGVIFWPDPMLLQIMGVLG